MSADTARESRLRAPVRSGQVQAAGADWHLSQVQIESFGAYAGRTVGPFAPGFNVVYGKNESGKTTTQSFIRDTLFGWKRASKNDNAYKPAHANRSGRLVFSDGRGHTAEVVRARTSDGLQGEAWVAADIDRHTYETLFALDGDQLRGLKDPSTLTAHLLTAGAGTDDSPAQVRQQLDAQIGSYHSRAAAHTHSFTNLSAQLHEADARVKAAAREADDLRDDERELQALQQRVQQLDQQVDQLNAQAAELTRQRGRLEDLEQQRDQFAQQYAQLEASVTGRTASDGPSSAAPEDAAAQPEGIPAWDTPAGKKLRQDITALQAERTRAEQAASLAQAAYEEAEARQEPLQRDDVFLKASERRNRTRRLQGVLSLLIPAVCLIAGIPLTLQGLDLGSLTITAFGIALVAAAVLTAIASAVILVRPDRSDEEVERRREEARLTLEQARARRDAQAEALRQLDQRISLFLTANHLEAAGGSLERARELLDDSRLEQMEERVSRRGLQDARAQLSQVRHAQDQAQQQVDALLAAYQARDAGDLEQRQQELDGLREQATRQTAELNHRRGELSERLAAARSATGFAQAKQEQEELRTRLEDSKHAYARLLLARRYLQAAIDDWERDSQPSVYGQASRLLAQMTGGSWVTVRPAEGGDVEVLDADGRARSPQLLSLGTCQQLYLALRIALLMTAQDVGRFLPVLADDILAMFDDDRRRSALQALLTLSRQRQVTLFTCHADLVALVRSLAPDANIVAL